MISILLLISGCSLPNFSKNDGTVGKETRPDDQVITSIGNDICREFPPDLVAAGINKAVVNYQPSPYKGVFACDYYTEYSDSFFKDELTGQTFPGGRKITIALENTSVDKQKKAIESAGGIVTSDPRIKTAHQIKSKPDGSIWSIDIILNPSQYLWINQSDGAATNEELIGLAINIAEKLLLQNKK